MTDQTILQLLTGTFQIALLLAGPLLLASIVVGLVISVLQVVTSIHDPTLSFVPRMLIIVGVAVVLLPWMMTKMATFTTELFSNFLRYVQ